jgi:hypothetical protein
MSIYKNNLKNGKPDPGLPNSKIEKYKFQI